MKTNLVMYIIPLDPTNQVLWTKKDGDMWAASGTDTSGLARDLLHWMLNSWSTNSVYVWDLVAAVGATDDRLCPSIPLALDVLVEPGPEQGRTVVVEGPPNAQVCLEPDIDQIKARVNHIFALIVMFSPDPYATGYVPAEE